MDAVTGSGARDAQLTIALAKLRQRLACAAEQAGRPVGDIELLPVTKFFPATDIAILNRLKTCQKQHRGRDGDRSLPPHRFVRAGLTHTAPG